MKQAITQDQKRQTLESRLYRKPANYMSSLDYVEKLSNDYTDLKDKYIEVRMKLSDMKIEMAKLLEEIKSLKEIKTPLVKYDWNEIKKDVRVTQHFKATKDARNKNRKLLNEVKFISDKYYSLLALHNSKKHRFGWQ